ncbi:uncharacterized protein LOC123388361 [Mustela putorius furo]|uniref:Uncharacterized protein LOC123388361 n=1 Tax=Mustela putorius furo TaxID=9669 RepID=A0A8U0RH14_MUSPF|nr:uncharacterized protein LOC123388361 [Mustela putorius furo]
MLRTAGRTSTAARPSAGPLGAGVRAPATAAHSGRAAARRQRWRRGLGERGAEGGGARGESGEGEGRRELGGAGASGPVGSRRGLNTPGAVPLLPPAPRARARSPGLEARGEVVPVGETERGRVRWPSWLAFEAKKPLPRKGNKQTKKGSVWESWGCLGWNPSPPLRTLGEKLNLPEVFPHLADGEMTVAFCRQGCGGVNKIMHVRSREQGPAPGEEGNSARQMV